MNKYKISFKYLESNRKTFKYVYAYSEEIAIKLFTKAYKDFNVEIIKITLL